MPPSKTLQGMNLFKHLNYPAIHPFSCPNVSPTPPAANVLHLLLGDNWLLPGQLGVVIPPAGPGSALDSWSSQNKQPEKHRNKPIIWTLFFVLH